MASEDIVEEQQPAVSDGGGQPTWMDDLGAYLNKKPNATDEELFRQFPQLNKDSKRLDAAFSYVHAKSQGMTDEDAKKLYPDLITPMGYAGAPQTTQPKDEPSPVPKIDMAAYGKKVLQDNVPATESTAGGSTKILQDEKTQEATAEQERKTRAKYKPIVDKAMANIEANKDAFIDNQRPALDYHPDAPDNFYEVPKMPAIDAYLKQTIQDPTTRYYVRSQIINQFQNNKDSYGVGKIAQRKIDDIPAVAQAKKEVADNPDNLGKPEDNAAILKRAKEIDPDLDTKVQSVEADAVKTHENIKNEFTRALLNNSTSLEYDENGNIRKVNTLDPNTPFHDQITGAGKALQGVFKFSGQAGQMASGILKFFGAKESGYNLQKTADDFLSQNAFPGGSQTPSEFLAGEALPMVLQGAAMGKFARGLGAPMFKALSGAAARGMIGKFAEGALGGVALAPINSALISNDYYTSLIRAGETPEVARAKAERVFDKNLVTDMAISPLQFGIMNAPVNNVIAKAALQYGISPLIAGVHFMSQDYFQQKENNPALTVWKYATSPDGIKTGIAGAVTGLLQHYVIGKMNDWQNEKTVKDAFSFGRKDQSPETAALPNNNVLASTVLNAFEMKDSPKRAGELSGLVDELHQKGVYTEQEAAKINGIIADVAEVKGQVPKMGTSAQRMAVFNELLNKKAYQDQMGAAGNSAVTDMLETKMKDSDKRIQAIMNEEEPLYFINGNETSKEQLMEWVKNNPDLVASKALNIDIINDDETKQAIQDAKNEPLQQEQPQSGEKAATPGEEVPAEAKTGVTEVRHAITAEDEKGVTSGPTDVRLNEEGKVQADKLGDEMTGKEVKKVLSSGLPRAAETAQIVADKLGVPHGTIPEIKSWDIGEFDKMKDTDFKKAEEYLVQHPDEKEFEGKKVSESFNEYKDRVIAAREKIEKEAGDHTLLVNHGGNINVWDAYQKNGRKWNTQAANDYLNAPDLEPASLRPPAQEGPKPVELPGRTPEFSKFYNDFKDEIGAVKDSSFDFRVDMPMDQKAREGAVKDIEKGKETKRAKLFLDELQKQHDAGVIEYTRGRGNHVEKFGIPIEELGKLQEAAEPQVLKDIESGVLPADELAKWLQEEADKSIENEPERAEGETGHASGEGETGASEGKLLHPVQEVDEAKTRDRPGSTENEPRPAGDSSARSLREAGEAKGDQHGKDQAAKNLEESDAINELAKRHGKSPLPKLKEDNIPADLEKKGIPVNNMVEADAHWGNGLRMFAFHEQDERPSEINSIEELRNYTPDQVLAYPAERNLSASADEHIPFKSTASALEEIGKYFPKDPLISRVIDFLKPIVDANPSIRIDNDYDFTGKPGIGYSEADGRIGIKYSRLPDKDALYRTTLHEMVHAATRAEIEKSAAFKDDIRDVLTEVRKALKLPDNDAIIPLLVQKGIIEADKYGASNEHELIAEIFTNQKFNDYLKGIKYNGDSLLKKFYLAIAKHFSSAYKVLVSAKSEISANNMADYLMKLTESVINKHGAEDKAGALPMIDKGQAINEQFVRERINDYKDATLIKALTVSGNMTEDEAKDLVKQVRDEQNLTPEDIIRQAMELGKKANAGAGKQIMAPMAAENMKPSLMKTLRRWYFDGKDEVSDVKSIIRKNKGAEEFEIDKIYHATRKLVNDWNKVPKVKQMAFMLGMEKPEFLAGQSQPIKDMATAYKGRLDKTFETIGKVLPDLNYVEDYFPHFWEKPEQARNFFASTLAKAPLEGGKSFAKKRFFETIVAGLKEGYKLSTTNPEEMVRLAEANAWKFTTAHDIFNDMKKAGYLKYSMTGDKPEGWKTVQDPLFTKIAASVDKNGNPDLVRGAFYMPPDVADLVDRYLSKGLSGPLKNVIQTVNNVKNLFQLGVGFFHFGTTTTDALVTGMTNGIQKLSAGNPKGLLDLATFGNLPATVARGFKARADWNAGILTKDTQALMDANAKVGRQKMYSLDAKYNMMKAFGKLRADADFKQIPKVLWNAMLYLPESINKPLMEHWVPSLKVGGYLRSLDSEISSRKNMTPAELQTAKQKIWDSMDDRLGQVVYDNIFVKKSLKDLAFLAIRSAGWTGGTIRAVSGGLAELPRSGQRLVSGQGLSQRTAYLAALPLTVGLMGAFYQYLMTGQGPKELKDYFFPKDGTKSPDGTDHRVDFPSYMKDIISYRNKPVTTFLHKTSPVVNDIVEMYKNKDFYGEKIYNSDDPFYQKGLDILKYEGESMEPFSFKKNPYDTSPFADQLTTRKGLEQKFGIMPAPKERERSDTQNAIANALSDQIGHKEEGKTHAEMEQIIARRHLREFIFNGGDFKDASDEWKEKAAITPRGLQKFIHESKMDPYLREFKMLTPANKVKVYQQMTDEEKEVYGHWIPLKDRAAANAPKPDDE